MPDRVHLIKVNSCHQYHQLISSDPRHQINTKEYLLNKRMNEDLGSSCTSLEATGELLSF